MLRHPQDLPYLARRYLELDGDLVGPGLASEPLDELALDVHDLVQLLDHVHRDPDRPRLVRDRPGDGLADPPGRVGRELVALAVVELLDRPDQAKRALLNQIEEAEAAAEIRLRDRDDEAKVRLDHLRLRGHVAALDPLRQIDLLVGGQQRHLADLSEVQPKRIKRRLDSQVELRRALDLFFDERLLVRQALVLLAFDELDAVIDQIGGEVLDLLFRELDFLDSLDDLVVGQEAFLLSRRDQLVEFLDVGQSNVDSEHESTTSGLAW